MASWAAGSSREGLKHGITPDATRGGCRARVRVAQRAATDARGTSALGHMGSRAPVRALPLPSLPLSCLEADLEPTEAHILANQTVL